MSKRLFKTLIVFMTVHQIIACSVLPTQESTSRCQAFNQSLISAIESESHFNPSVTAPEKYKYLRSNRFLASFNKDALSPSERSAWLESLRTFSVASYLEETQRLSENALKKVLATAPEHKSLPDALAYCSKQEIESLNHSNLDVAAPKHSYSTWLRVAGLYSLTSLMAQGGIEDYQQDMTQRYTEGANKPFLQETLYSPKTSNQVKQIPSNDSANSNALGIPSLSKQQLATLFQRHAPQLLVETNQSDDMLGGITLLDDGKIHVDTTQPKAYTFTTFTRWQGKVLLQLNYGLWFPSRPQEKDFDIYAGSLDGIIWRVTLDENGEPLLYDSIHQCGCYHKLYLPETTTINLDSLEGEKPLWFPIQTAKPNQKLRLKVEATTHYIIDVTPAQLMPEAVTYRISQFSDLLALPHNQGRTSLFGESGIIEQSSRTERWFLWPLGVPNAGAMRQPGLHAVAFIGKRHFDDPFLLDTFGIQRK